MIFYQKENFIPNLDNFLKEIYKIPLYDSKKYSELEPELTSNWPGKRSLELQKKNKELINQVMYWINDLHFLPKGTCQYWSHVHFRGEQDGDKDWIHKDDTCDYAILIYLGQSNERSGTVLYDDYNNMVNDIKYVQNRLISYSANYNHMGYGHFGDNMQNGRLTLNIFLKYNKE